MEPVLDAVGDIQQYIFCSSAGVYLKSDQMPHREEDATDPKSRHKVCACRQSRALSARIRSTTRHRKAFSVLRCFHLGPKECMEHP